MSRFARISRSFTGLDVCLAAWTAILLSCASGAAQQVAQPLSYEAARPYARSAPDGALRVAVPEFSDHGSAEELAFLRSGLPLLLRVSLLSHPGISFVEAAASSESSGQEDAASYGADLLLQGSYFYYEGSIRLDAEVHELGGGGKVSISSGVFPLEELYSAVNDLANELNGSLPELRRGSGAKRIAVACFANASEPAAEQQRWIGNDLGKYLSSHLRSNEDMAVLPWNEKKQGCPEGGRPRRPQALLADLKADALLAGRFELSDEEITVFPELHLVDRDARLPLPAVTGSAARLLDIEELVAEDAQGILGILLEGRILRLNPFLEEIGVEEARERATSLLRQNEDLPLALWLFHRVIELAPGDPSGHAGVGACRLASGRYGQALRELSLAAQFAPHRADIQKLLGDVYLKLNRLEDAVYVYSRAADLAPESPEYPLKLGIALQLEGEYARALEVLQTSLQKGAPPAAAYVAIANVHRSAGALHQATAAFREALASNPDSREARLGLSEVLSMQANAAIRRGDHDSALDLIRTAKDLNPSSQTHAALSYIFNIRREYEAAVAATQEAEQAGLTNSTVFHNRAFALSRLDRRDEALNAYDEALRLAPDSVLSLVNKADLLIQLRRPSEARDLLAKISLDKATIDHRVQIARVLARLGDYPAALAQAEAALRLNPKSDAALNAKGSALNRAGRFKEALDALNTGIQLTPENSSLHTNRAFALVELGRYKDAIAAADRAMSINSRGAAARNHKGYSLYQEGRTEEGVQLIREAIDLDRTYGGSHYNLARIYTREGRTEEALSELAVAFELDLWYRTLALRSPEFESLRLDPSFELLLARFEQPGEVSW